MSDIIFVDHEKKLKEEIFNNSKGTVLHFYADWCEPCKDMDKLCDQLAKRYQNIQFCKIEAEKLTNLTQSYNVKTVPTFLFFDAKGKEKSRLESANPSELTKLAKSLEETIEQSLQGDTQNLNQKLHSLINKSPVMLFMKGSPNEPKCGFSSRMVNILREENIKFEYFDILKDENVRQGLKTYSNWPTYPQLYVKGELVGGLDIVKEMQEDSQGQLQEELGIDSENGSTDLNTKLDSLIKKSPVMLFMKGSPDEPRCGFSAKTVDILQKNNVKFDYFDILKDENVRQGLKTYSNWPTYPQLYSKGELIGGFDIVKELDENGELTETLQS